MNSTQASSGVPRIALSAEEAATSAGVSRTRIFQAIKSGEMTCRKSGKTTVIEVAELARWVRSLPTKGRNPEENLTA